MEESSSDSWQRKRCFCSHPDWPSSPSSLLIRLIPENLSVVLKQMEHEAHPHIVPGLGISRAIPPLLIPSCCVQGEYTLPTYHIQSGSRVHPIPYPVGSKDSPQGYTGQRLKPATYCHLVLRLEMHSSLSICVEQFLVHIFLHFNCSCWKSSYICVEVEDIRCIRSFYVLLQLLSGLLWPPRPMQSYCLTVIRNSATQAPPFGRPRI
jgi:hypothetical protein